MVMCYVSLQANILTFDPTIVLIVEGQNVFFFSSTQQCLPVTGAPLSRARDDQNRIKFNNWLQIRTKEEWRFHIFGLVIQPWFTSYQKAVSTAGAQEFMRTISHWLQEDCSLPILRSSQSICFKRSILYFAVRNGGFFVE